MKEKIAMVSLGCPKNQVDAEVMLKSLADAGYIIGAEEAEADIIIINTCGFIESAKAEAIENILEASAYKTDGNCKALIVTGCLAQRYQDEIKKEIPEVDAILGTNSYEDIVNAVHQALDGKFYQNF